MGFNRPICQKEENRCDWQGCFVQVIAVYFGVDEDSGRIAGGGERAVSFLYLIRNLPY
jgi:hypothetical protein